VHRYAFGLFGQIVAILFVSVLLESVASSIVYERASQFSIDGDKARRLAEHLVLSAKLVEEAPPEEQAQMARTLITTRYHLSLSHEQAERQAMASPQLGQITRQVVEWEPDLKRRDLRLLLQTQDGVDTITGVMRLKDGGWLSFRARDTIYQQDLKTGRMLTALIPALSLIILGTLVVRHTLRPMRELRQAAEAIGKGRTFTPVPVRGASEVREVVSAFNSMQQRIERLIADHTQALAAVGHDFRTPLARLRLRAEAIADIGISRDIQQDVTEMEQMIESLLAYLAGEHNAAAEDPALIDISVLCATFADDKADSGFDVSYHGPEHCLARLRPVAIRRVMSNLIDNALHYAHLVEVRLDVKADELVISVEDNGPGIPEDQREHVLTPFARLDVARMRDTTGFGLGLPIVARVASIHGGHFTLETSHLGGLLARLNLPLER
jgi:two-component system osmolarity sensor histidine kinase EnvZ